MPNGFLNHRLIQRGLILTTLLLAGCAETSNENSRIYENDKPEVQSNVIYGVDGRLDLYQVSDDRLKQLAKSTVALVSAEDLSNLPNGQMALKGESFQQRQDLCESEKFKEQPTTAFCSGSLVGPNLVMTAGHCIMTDSDCESVRFVFDYALQGPSALPTVTPLDKVYKCKSIIKTVKTSGADFALIELDRPVLDRPVLKIERSRAIAMNEEVLVIGHPVGLPTKVTTGGTVRANSHADFFVTNLDTYGGNSGSAVFNSKTGLIEGILVRGERDFTLNGNCYVSFQCKDDQCRGEDVTRVSLLKDLIPQSGQLPPVVDPVKPSEDYVLSSTTTLAIPDKDAVGVQSKLTSVKNEKYKKVLVSLDIKHPYIGDLVLEVTSPSGKKAVLHSRAGGRSQNILRTIEVTSQLGSNAEVGVYTLSLKDMASRDVGSLQKWSLEFRN